MGVLEHLKPLMRGNIKRPLKGILLHGNTSDDVWIINIGQMVDEMRFFFKMEAVRHLGFVGDILG